ncbi:S1 motif domain-containing protein [Citrus sinensis]|uniref:S1 motif domain-containing protein n=1 Tax=Citrus sinensis TaxID=2711 RepID=A0ACB8LXB0_CITSI|nr:S1 motif domain-containing protein [Citrus sinensis]
MDGLFVTTTATASSFSAKNFLFHSVSSSRSRTRVRVRRKNIYFPQRSKFCVFAAKEEPKFDQWDLMELKFGKMLGEDPKLTLAKIMGRKVNPEASYLEIEKQFYKNKGKMPEINEVPFDVSDEKKPSSSSSDGLNLVRPVPKKGVKSQDSDRPLEPQIKKPSPSVKRAIDRSKSSIPNVILRKPTMVNADDVEDMPSRLRMKPNLSLKMKNEQAKEKFSDMTLLRRPEATTVNVNDDKKADISGSAEAKFADDGIGVKTRNAEGENNYVDFTLLEKPSAMTVKANLDEKQEQLGDAETRVKGHDYVLEEPTLEDNSVIGMQQPEQIKMMSTEVETSANVSSERNLVDSSVDIAMESSLPKKPRRLDQSIKEREEAIVVSSEHEGADWARAESLVKTGERTQVELISASTRGFAVSFGSLVGFLPYRNLATKWKFLAFETWLRGKGLDPSMYRQSLAIIGNRDMQNKTSTPDSSVDLESNQEIEGEISPEMKLDDLLRIYDQGKLKFLLSFVGQKINVNVVMADRKFRKLIVSVRPKEREELVEKKRSLMAKLRIGDIVKCCIKKITYFGVFVEVEGVPALIHQTEVSWDATLDPASYFKIGQVVEAKVHQLDFALERIFLSLKEITPDPLTDALESVVGGRDPLDGRLEAAQADTEWADVESLIRELQKVDGIESVSKGRFFVSPGLAPTFQVYMSSMFENQYKLLARSGNKVQEVIVQASLDKEAMKSTILSCTNRVE